MEAQIVGLCALALSTLSFQLNTRKKILIAQIFTAVLFSVHYGMLGAVTGAAMNGISVIRNLIFYYRDRKFFSGNIWVAIFVGVNLITGILFWQDWTSVLCIAAIVISTVSLSLKDPKYVRMVLLLSSPFFLAYSVVTGSIGGALNDLIAGTSGVIAVIRYRNGEKSF